MTTPHSVGCFGKLPSHGDFVRHGEESAWRRQLFGWWVEGWSLALSTGRIRDLDRRLFALAATDRGDRCVAVVAQPSRDQVGRRFPFVVHALFDGDMNSPGAALQRLGSWLQQAVPVVELATRGLDVASAKAHVDSLARRETDTVEDGARSVETPAATLLRHGATATFAEWLRSAEYSLSTGGRPEYVVRCSGAATIGEVAFAMDLFAALGMAPVRMAVFDEAPDRGFCLRLLSHDLAPRYLPPLFWADAASDHAWDVAPGRDQVPASFTGRLGSALDVETATVQQLLEVARHGPR